MTVGVQFGGQGLGGAGLPTAIVRTPIRQVAAKRYDPREKAYVVLDDGQYDSVHPVDAWVVNQCMFVRGSILSAMNIGNPALAETHLAEDFAAKVAIGIRGGLNAKVVSGEIILHRVFVSTLPATSTASVQVEYTNVALGPEPRQPIQIPIGSA